MNGTLSMPCIMSCAAGCVPGRRQSLSRGMTFPAARRGALDMNGRRCALEPQSTCSSSDSGLNDAAEPRTARHMRTSGSLDLTVHGQYNDFKLLHRGRWGARLRPARVVLQLLAVGSEPPVLTFVVHACCGAVMGPCHHGMLAHRCHSSIPLVRCQASCLARPCAPAFSRCRPCPLLLRHASVYTARDRHTLAKVVVKTFPKARMSAQMLGRARREFALVMNRCHDLPNVVRARRLVEDADAIYTVFEEIAGAQA